uniref:Uncharacterized protein n=1 Tax=Meloidogyne enterolobii TaxID=390850 RepID=A0A6V7Y8B1_MELEN|nr:unnamed protein product [Meloidogyne enterolobii]
MDPNEIKKEPQTPSSQKRASLTFARNHPGSLSPRRLPTSASYASALSSTTGSAFNPSAVVRRELELERAESSASTTRASSARRQQSIGPPQAPVSRRSMDFDPTNIANIRQQRRSLMGQLSSNVSTTGVSEGTRKWNVWKIRKLAINASLALQAATTKIDNRPAIIIEIGNRLTKIGFAGEFVPLDVFRTEWLDPMETPGRTVPSPIFCRDWSEQEQYERLVKFFRVIVFRKLINPIASRRVVIVESLLTPTWQRQALAHALFDCTALAPHSILFAPSHLLCSFTFNTKTCIVLDLGANEAVLFPIVEGILMLHNWETSINSCASALEMEAKRLMLKYGRVRRHPVIVLESCDEGGEEAEQAETSDDGRPFAECDLPLADSMRLWEDLVFRFCFVTTAARGRRLQTHLANPDSPYLTRPVPPVQLQFGSELLYIPGIVREAVAELLFTHNDESGCRSVPQLILDCISRVSIDLRRVLLQNLLIVGGISRLSGFLARLKTELLDLIADGYKPQISPKLVDIKFYQFPREIAGELFCSWLGGSLFCSTDYNIDQRSITRQEWLRTRKVKDWTEEIDKYFSNLNINKGA